MLALAVPSALRALGRELDLAGSTDMPTAPLPVPPPHGLTPAQWLLRELAPYGAGIIRAIGVAMALVILASAMALCVGRAP